MNRRSLPVLGLVCGFLVFAQCGLYAQAAGFNQAGLVLWLDASDAASVVRDANGGIVAWKDKSGQAHHAVPGEGSAKVGLVEAAMNGLPVVRFDGTGFLDVPPIRSTPGKLAVFIVAQRLPAQTNGREWQRLISSTDGSTGNDNKRPSFNLIHPPDGKGSAFGPTVKEYLDDDVKIGPLAIGSNNQRLKGNHLSGDIAEILVFDREFVSEDATQGVIRYLSEKWKAASSRVHEGWTRVGPLGETPVRANDRYPLTDQNNQAGWSLHEPTSDEFNGDQLDAAKWWDHNPTWRGRKPALFMPHNVEVHGGLLRLTMKNETVAGAPQGYDTFTSAAVQSRTRVRYGYFEIRAKPMRSGGSSAFWFYYADDKDHTEIDVFEIGGGAPGFERKYNMNQHVFRTPAEKRHWSVGGVWMAPWNLADDFHTYGLEWDDKELSYYVDGVRVRRAAGSHWHQALTVNFDSETMPTWFGLPDPKDLPSTFEIDYIRTWKKAGQVEEPVLK
ncbi:MAG: family 16 glycosylhydrolase [Opitutaceae bacterium]|nr:family 16 glycosylhydrolase [Opitutaceae bacterium]